MNHLSDIKTFSYGIYGLRHGQSKPNIATPHNATQPGIIVSDPAVGTDPSYGLTETGRLQVAESAQQALQSRTLDQDTLILSSDFSRASESARIAAEILSIREIIFVSSLRERSFGKLEGSSSQNYQLVWDEDEIDPGHQLYGVESVNQVLDRTTALVAGILNSRKSSEKNILLVSHGDSLQILETAFRQKPASHHRYLPHLQTAEIRRYA